MKYTRFSHKSLLAALSLSAAMVLLLTGCKAGQAGLSTTPQTQPETLPATEPATEPVTEPVTEPSTESTVTWEPVITVDPGELIGTLPLEPDPASPAPGEEVSQAQVVRAQDISQSALESLMAQYPGDASVPNSMPLIHLTTADELKAFLAEAGSDVLKEACTGYDDVFFLENDLLIVPRVTNTGSARHSVSLQVEDQVVTAVITVTTPEIVTMDMANWFLVIPVSKADTAGRICAAQMAGGGSVVLPPDNRVTR